MVAPHPDLMKKLRNTKKLVRENNAHLIPDLVKDFPDHYLPLDKFSIFDIVKPWIEETKPQKQSNQENKRNVKTMALPSLDKIMVVYVDFPDQQAQISINDISNRFFSATGKSLKTYYMENSYNKYIPAGEVHGVYRLPQNLSYYANNESGLGNYPTNAQKLTQDAIDLVTADPAINWSQFDSGNGEIDYFMIVHAGAEAAYTGSPSDIWAHVWFINPVIKNGYRFQYYGVVSEYMGNPLLDPQRTGVDSHEFGHLLGLPDLYDYSGNSNGAGNFSLMASGSWVDNGINPVHMDAWSKYFCGFTNTLVDLEGTLQINDAETHDTNYLFTTQYANEYFMVENRQNIYFDTFLPANGLMIWKINVSQLYNDNELCYRVGLVQADGMKHLENSVNYGDPGDSYPGTTINRAIGFSTLPSNILCNSSYPSFKIWSITDSAITMSFIAELCPQLVTNIQIV